MIITFNTTTQSNFEIYATDKLLPINTSEGKSFIRVPNNLKGLSLLTINRDSLAINNGYLEQNGQPMFTFEEIKSHLTEVFTSRVAESIPSNTNSCLEFLRLILEGDTVGIPIVYPLLLPSNTTGEFVELATKQDLDNYHQQLLLTRISEARFLVNSYISVGNAILNAASQAELNSIGV